MRQWEAREVTPKELSQAREKREWEQGRMIRKYGCPLVFFTLDVAGTVKTSPQLEQLYRRGIGRIRASLADRGVEPVKDHEFCRSTGYEYYAAVKLDCRALKRMMAEIEDSGEQGLYRIEVLSADRRRISRAEATMSWEKSPSPKRVCEELPRRRLG